MKKRVLFARLLLVIYITIIAFLCLHTFKDSPVIPKKLWGYPGDKVVHFFMFVPLPYITYAAYDKKNYKYATTLLVFLGIILIGTFVAGGSEIAQYLFTQHRKADLKDFYADMCAIIPGTAIVCTFDFLHSVIKSRHSRGISARKSV